MSCLAGAATRRINCEIGDDLSGQLHRRFCRRIRDDLEANFLYLSSGETAILLVNLDLLGTFEPPTFQALRRQTAAAAGLPERNVLITSTHTHAGPETFGLIFDAPVNEAYLSRLGGWLAEGAREAVAAARPARVGWAGGQAHVGYNRRLCWRDGTHTMYGDASRPDFNGIEGPDDPQQTVLAALDEEDRPIALVHNNCCHMTCLESADYASADFAGEARRVIREALAVNLPVLYLQGASGDISPWDMLRVPPRYPGERRLREVGGTVAMETLRLLRELTLTDQPILRHAYEDLTLAVRLPTADQLRRAEEVERLGPEKVKRWDYVIQVSGVLRLYRKFKDHPEDTLAVHAVRIGDLAIATNPCELYCQFGLDIKRRSPARLTMISQLTDGFAGYCPTLYAILGGGYSGEAIYWTRLEPYAGYKLVETAARLLHGLWH